MCDSGGCCLCPSVLLSSLPPCLFAFVSSSVWLVVYFLTFMSVSSMLVHSGGRVALCE